MDVDAEQPEHASQRLLQGLRQSARGSVFAIDSDKAEDLWTWMNGQRAAGNEVLAISHNANLSNGLMFPIEVDSKGRPIDDAWAQERILNEPLTEIKQVKGASETHPELSPNDEFAGFEIMNYLIGIDKKFGQTEWHLRATGLPERARDAGSRGYNPYKFGIVGAGNSHNSATSYSQSNFFGDHGLVDPTPETRLSGTVASGMNILQTGTSGLAGVWAEENTRDSIFAAMQRKETFGTSGVRIRVRLFGGWEYDRAWSGKGIGSRLPMRRACRWAAIWRPRKAKRPHSSSRPSRTPRTAISTASRSSRAGARTARRSRRSIDVAWSGDRSAMPGTGKLPPVGNTVDIMKATYTNTIGAVELKQVWTDPEFDSRLQAFYYASVHCRFPRRAGAPMTPASWEYCRQATCPPPSRSARGLRRSGTRRPHRGCKSAEPGTLAAELLKGGATALGDDELKQLVVGKTLKVRNTVTDQTSDVLFRLDGQRFHPVERRSAKGRRSAEVMHTNVSGSSASYEIKDGHIVTTIDRTPFELTVYRSGDKYVAARSNEFGYANYEVEFVER